jgi:hypothetical protein
MDSITILVLLLIMFVEVQASVIFSLLAYFRERDRYAQERALAYEETEEERVERELREEAHKRALVDSISTNGESYESLEAKFREIT